MAAAAAAAVTAGSSGAMLVAGTGTLAPPFSCEPPSVEPVVESMAGAADRSGALDAGRTAARGGFAAALPVPTEAAAGIALAAGAAGTAELSVKGAAPAIGSGSAALAVDALSDSSEVIAVGAGGLAAAVVAAAVDAVVAVDAAVAVGAAAATARTSNTADEPKARAPLPATVSPAPWLATLNSPAAAAFLSVASVVEPENDLTPSIIARAPATAGTASGFSTGAVAPALPRPTRARSAEEVPLE